MMPLKRSYSSQRPVMLTLTQGIDTAMIEVEMNFKLVELLGKPPKIACRGGLVWRGELLV